MVYLFYTTNISVDLAYHEIFRAKVGKGGIKHDKAAMGADQVNLFKCIWISRKNVGISITVIANDWCIMSELLRTLH